MKHVISYPTVTDALATEKLAKEKGWVGQIISLPPFLEAGCGFAFEVEEVSEDEIIKAFEEAQIKYEKIVEQ